MNRNAGWSLAAAVVMLAGMTAVAGAQANAKALPAGSVLCKDGSNAPKGPDACSKHGGVDLSATGAAKAANSAAREVAKDSARKARGKAKAVEQKTAKVAPGGGPGMVWVNTKSGVIHRPGDESYGKTKEGKYMTEADAKQQGYRERKSAAVPKKKP